MSQGQAGAARRTVRLCYAGMAVLALVINLAPPLFVPLKLRFDLTFEQLGRLVFINFATQVTFDILCAPLVDRLGARPFAVLANVLAAAGLGLFACAGVWCPARPWLGLAVGTAVFSMGGGMLELLLSPIVNAMPSDRKAADMSLLHAFYAIGQVLVIGLTVLALAVLGAGRWRHIVAAWALLPALVAAGFLGVRIPRFVPEAERTRLRDLVRMPVYLAAVAAIGLAGATELAISQWLSSFAERGLGFHKATGDLAGCGLFALAMAAGRLWMGLRGGQVCVRRVLAVSCWSCCTGSAGGRRPARESGRVLDRRARAARVCGCGPVGGLLRSTP